MLRGAPIKKSLSSFPVGLVQGTGQPACISIHPCGTQCFFFEGNLHNHTATLHWPQDSFWTDVQETITQLCYVRMSCSMYTFKYILVSRICSRIPLWGKVQDCLGSTSQVFLLLHSRYRTQLLHHDCFIMAMAMKAWRRK